MERANVIYALSKEKRDTAYRILHQAFHPPSLGKIGISKVSRGSRAQDA